jgi:N-dimethylarginine dimethylaminohydrolase
MCDPSQFTVSYAINPWMQDNIHRVESRLAYAQWSQLYEAISNVVEVTVLLEHSPYAPDLVFTANAGKVIGDKVILSNFRNSERKPEEPIFENFFQNMGKNIIKMNHSYEGEGDHLVDSNNEHWIGYGFRTDIAAKPELETILNTTVNAVELVDPRWYHLDTCFAPLPNNTLVWYPPAFSVPSREFISNKFENLIPVCEEDALQFACNLVEINGKVFIPKNNELTGILKNNGFDVAEFDLSEFMKSGGAAKCLVLNL